MNNIYLLYTAVVMFLLVTVATIVVGTLSLAIVSFIPTPSIFFTNQVALASELQQRGEYTAKVYEQLLNGE